MQYPLKDDFKPGALAPQMSPDWLNVVARILNGIQAVGGGSYIHKTPDGEGWEIRLPLATASSVLPGYTGKASHVLAVTSGENGVEWVTVPAALEAILTTVGADQNKVLVVNSSGAFVLSSAAALFLPDGAASGDVFWWNGSAVARLAADTAGKALTTQGAGNAPEWTDLTDLFLQIGSNLADLNDATVARENLGLGDSATRDVGTGAADVAAGQHYHDALYAAFFHEHWASEIKNVDNGLAWFEAGSLTRIDFHGVPGLFLPVPAADRWILRATGISEYAWETGVILSDLTAGRADIPEHDGTTWTVAAGTKAAGKTLRLVDVGSGVLRAQWADPDGGLANGTANGQILYWNSTASEWQTITGGTSNQILAGNGTTSAPSYKDAKTVLGAPSMSADRYKVLQVTDTSGNIGWDWVRAH